AQNARCGEFRAISHGFLPSHSSIRRSSGVVQVSRQQTRSNKVDSSSSFRRNPPGGKKQTRWVILFESTRFEQNYPEGTSMQVGRSYSLRVGSSCYSDVWRWLMWERM